MKVKALSRSERTIGRECVGDVRLQHRNLDPHAHPMHKAREYTRAVQSAKLDRIFAKPFVGALGGGHSDAISVTRTSRSNLVQFVSGSIDGVMKVWDLGSRSCVTTYERAHMASVTGLSMCDFTKSNIDHFCLSCGEDGNIRQWKLIPSSGDVGGKDEDGLVNTWRHPGKNGGSFKSLDTHWSNDQFATASDNSVDVWSPTRSTPIQSYGTNHLWGDGDTVTVVRYNPAEPCLLAHCSMDRGVGLHDIRVGSDLKKTILSMRCNTLEWNPMEPMHFVVGNEDHNCYSFDMRRLDVPSMIHKGHVGAVLSVGWSPTGREFVSGSYDRTVRIFGYRDGTSREMYHNKRMQRVFSVNFTSDDRYVLSGSDDTNIRLWKARASEKVGSQLTTREERAMEYRQAIVKKFSHMPEIRQIQRSGKRKGPKIIRKMTATKQVQKESVERKEENRAKHSKPGTHMFKSERSKVVIRHVD